ncbi:GLPGLI family protein [Lutibacter sp.]|uniref:GLPGLI family protein n=1 Tax=Lutibacter sp. TaxID=1925666 RepID=UPI0025BC9D9F|nr:GLPGLI family protein [Lutibacter sp.]MCF6181742.1 GLPGLI family protein [Lutibacter sp.]
MKIFFILMLMANLGFAQNKKGEIVYRKETTKFISESRGFQKNKENQSKYYNTVLMIDKNTKSLLKTISFKLRFNNYESIFMVDNFLNLETNRFTGIAVGPEGSGIYYSNQNNNENLKQVDAYGEKFLIKEKTIHWTLINETKKIGEYNCYKAITTKISNSSKGKVEQTVTVWYTPEINIPFGPIGYGGLPGLVMELSMYNYRYYVIKIELNPKNEVIVKKPTQGKKVTEEEFREIGKKAMESLKKGF